MTKALIKDYIRANIHVDGLHSARIPGVQFFRASEPIPCAPAVYEPSLIAIVSGSKETVLDGNRYVYDSAKYLCCPMTMPVSAGTPSASAENPLYGVLVTLDPRLMTEIAVEMENAGGVARTMGTGPAAQGVKLADWDDRFTDALTRLVQLNDCPTDAAVLGEARLRELYYAVLKGEAGGFARRAFGVGNAIARSIAHVAANLNAPMSIDEMADRAHMSRAVFHRKFKQATSMSPIQFVKSMRLNKAAMKIAGGMNVNEAAMIVGYISPSQFSREFKRMYGQSPRQWGYDQQRAIELV